MISAPDSIEGTEQPFSARPFHPVGIRSAKLGAVAVIRTGLNLFLSREMTEVNAIAFGAPEIELRSTASGPLDLTAGALTNDASSS